MKRRDFFLGLAVGIALGSPVFAEAVVDSVVRQLRNLGFRSIVQERTLLGRVRITARRKDGLREIIINPRTGEILRDLWTTAGGSDAAPIIDDQHVRDEDDEDHDDEGNHDDDGNHDEDDKDDDKDNGDNDNSGSGGSGGDKD